MNILLFIVSFIIIATAAPIDEELVLGESDGDLQFGRKLTNRNYNNDVGYTTLYLQQFDIPDLQRIDQGKVLSRKIRVAEPQYYGSQGGYGNQGGYGYNYGGNRRPGYGNYGSFQYGQNYGGYGQHQQNYGHYRG